MVSVKNTTRTAKIYNVPCRPGCEGDGCFCTLHKMPLFKELPDGTKGVQILERRLAGSVTIRAGEIAELEDWMLESSAVRAAVARDDLRVVTNNGAPRARSERQ